MNRFKTVFPQRHAILPVVHVAEADPKLALENVLLAREAGADGVFLINHEGKAGYLLGLYAEVVEKVPDWWIGLNLLGVSPMRIFDLIARVTPLRPHGLWTDTGLIREGSADQPEAELVLDRRREKWPTWDGLYFGGVAFKYQNAVKDVAAVAKAAVPFMDVVTTSGPATGSAADPDKIRLMKIAMGDSPLAIASGLTVDNVHEFLPWASALLVATGVSKSFTQLDGPKLRAFVDRVRSAKS